MLSTILLILCMTLTIVQSVHVLIERQDISQDRSIRLMGRAHPDHQHTTIFAVKQINLDLLEKILYDVSIIESPNYGKHKTFEEVGDIIANPIATRAVTDWLLENKVYINHQSTFGEYITCTASVSLWEDLLQTTFHQYNVDDVLAYASTDRSATVVRSTSYSLPEHLRDHVHAVFRTVDMPPRTSRNAPVIHEFKDLKQSSQIDLEGFTTYIIPSVLKNMYGVSGTGGGYSSQAIYATIGQTFLESDISLFQTTYGYPATPIAKYVGNKPNDTICRSDATSDNCYESSYDLQYIMTMGQDVPTTFFYDSSLDGSFFTFFSNISDTADVADVYSMSYTAYESDISSPLLTSVNTELIKLGARGVTIFAASGDDGVAGFYYPSKLSQCGYYAQWPASSPYVTAVGGTMNGPLISGSPEVVCSSQFGVSGITSGGGFSNKISAPSFQKKAISNYTSKYTAKQSSVKAYSTSNRGYPDLSLAANLYSKSCMLPFLLSTSILHVSVWIEGIVNAKEVFASGTSFSAPVLAGIVSLINSYRLQNGGSTVGWLNPSIYRYFLSMHLSLWTGLSS